MSMLSKIFLQFLMFISFSFFNYTRGEQTSEFKRPENKVIVDGYSFNVPPEVNRIEFVRPKRKGLKHWFSIVRDIDGGNSTEFWGIQYYEVTELSKANLEMYDSSVLVEVMYPNENDILECRLITKGEFSTIYLIKSDGFYVVMGHANEIRYISNYEKYCK